MNHPVTHEAPDDRLRWRSAFLSVDEVADYLGLSARTVRRLIANGQLPGLRTRATGGKIRVPKSAIDALTELATSPGSSVIRVEGTEQPQRRTETARRLSDDQ